MRISTLVLGLLLFAQQGPFAPLRNGYKPAGSPPVGGAPVLNTGSSCHSYTSCVVTVPGAGTTLLIGTITMGSATANSVSDSAGSPTSVSNIGFISGYNGDVHLFIEPNASTGSHTVTLSAPSGTVMSNMWVAVITGTAASPLDAGPSANSISGIIDAFSCPALTSTTANILAITWFALPGAGAFPAVSTESNLPSIVSFAASLYNPPLVNYGDNINWQYGSFSTGPGSLLAKVAVDTGAPSGACISIVLKA